MKDKQLFKIYFNQELLNPSAVYNFIAATQATKDLSTADIVAALMEREERGGIQIAPQVLLPHFESVKLKESQVICCHLKDSIPRWDSDIEEIKLIIAILLKQDESVTVKKEIASFTRKLADDEYIEKLVSTKNQKEFTALISELAEE